jgi:hypothetical protein
VSEEKGGGEVVRVDCGCSFGAVVQYTVAFAVLFKGNKTVTFVSKGACRQLREAGEASVDVDPCEDAEGLFFCFSRTLRHDERVE